MPPKRVSLGARIAQDAPATPAAPAPPAAPVSAALWSEEAPRQDVIGLSVTQIMPNAQQPRTLFDEHALAELAASIREHGVLQPILVRPIALTKWEGHARRYELIAGERRWRASMLADQATIPAIIRPEAADPMLMIELALIENLQRADLNPLEEAVALGRMRDDLGYSIRRIASRLGRSKGYVENRLRLLDLDEGSQRVLAARPDAIMHVGEIAKIDDPALRDELLVAVQSGLSFKELQHRLSLRKDSAADQAGPDTAGTTPAPAGPVPLADQRVRRAVHGNATADSDVHNEEGDRASSLLAISAAERAAWISLRAKIDRWQQQPDALSVDDRALLASIAERLGRLLT